MTALALLLAALPLSAEPFTFKGESCQVCHAKVRDADPDAPRPNPEFEGKRRFVVIGAGLSGLSAGWALKNEDVLILEKEVHAGGKARRESLGPWKFATGAVYTNPPEGRIKTMYKDLRIYPRKLRDPVHVYQQDGKRVPNWLSLEGLKSLARSKAEVPQLECLHRELTAYGKAAPMNYPIQNSPDMKAVARLDSVTFHDYLFSHCGARAAEFGDHYARDVFGAGAKDYSAALGFYYMGMELGDSYNWEGGLGEIADGLHRRLGDKVRTGALVEEVLPGKDSVRVVYQKGGKRFSVEASAVVVAVQSSVAKRIIRGLSERKKAAMEKVRYSVYGVMPIRFKKPVYTGSFVLWTPGTIMVDFTFSGGDMLTGPRPRHEGQLGEAYLALGGSAGRAWLLSASDEEIKDKVFADMETVLPGASKEVSDWRIIRWGHAMPIMGPGYLMKVQPILRENEGRIFFAGVDTQAPSVEGAMYSGLLAADSARAHLKTLGEEAR